MNTRDFLETINKRSEYNPAIDYAQVLKDFFSCLERGEKDKAGDLLKQHGGLIALYGNLARQQKEK